MLRVESDELAKAKCLAIEFCWSSLTSCISSGTSIEPSLFLSMRLKQRLSESSSCAALNAFFSSSRLRFSSAAASLRGGIASAGWASGG